jgi:hypothetical protein
MARLRVSQGMTVLGWNDLRLTREESDAIAAVADRLDALRLGSPGKAWQQVWSMLATARGSRLDPALVDSVNEIRDRVEAHYRRFPADAAHGASHL